MIYLATPYSDVDPEVRKERFQTVNRVAAKLIQGGHHVFSPISHTHPIALEGDLPLGWDYWEEYDRKMLSVCSEMFVVRLPGWEESTGVRAEMDIAKEMGIPVRYLDPHLFLLGRLER